MGKILSWEGLTAGRERGKAGGVFRFCFILFLVQHKSCGSIVRDTQEAMFESGKSRRCPRYVLDIFNDFLI